MFYSDKFSKNQEGIKKTPQMRSFFIKYRNQRTIRLP